MLIAMLGIIIFGALFVIPRFLKVVGDGPVGPLYGRGSDSHARPRPAPPVREARRAHGRGKSRGNSAHHAGL